ncbi:LOW QUALITY PROTEIN: hypothetical protein HID58_049696 [Brassica napus]|uniref:Squalene monooxygenase n=1 Tax=Brassica napus TaxID=3708 RepID=A0ABQ8B6Q7_BRANA|nr:LOW QUALITY PROTEIN: hypothetical protein HID58_049696 [Brassica napus]
MMPFSNLSDSNKVSEILKSVYNIHNPMASTVKTLGSAFSGGVTPIKIISTFLPPPLSAFSQLLVASTDEAKEAMRRVTLITFVVEALPKTMGLLGGMNPRPLSLICQFFSMSLFSVGSLLYPFPFPLRIWHSLKLLWLSLRMLGPHLKAEGVRQMLSPASACSCVSQKPHGC